MRHHVVNAPASLATFASCPMARSSQGRGTCGTTRNVSRRVAAGSGEPARAAYQKDANNECNDEGDEDATLKRSSRLQTGTKRDGQSTPPQDAPVLTMRGLLSPIACGTSVDMAFRAPAPVVHRTLRYVSARPTPARWSPGRSPTNCSAMMVGVKSSAKPRAAGMDVTIISLTRGPNGSGTSRSAMWASEFPTCFGQLLAQNAFGCLSQVVPHAGAP